MNCPDDSFQCSNGCISWDYVCDGVTQCENGEDETICGPCKNNEFDCLDGTKMSCELSCTILGFIPCSKYRNRITCLRYFPDALGSFYKNNFNKLTESTVKSTNNYTNSFIFFISAVSIFVLLIIGLILLIIIYKKYCYTKTNNLLLNHKNSIKKSNEPVVSNDDRILTINNRLLTIEPLTDSITKLSTARRSSQSSSIIEQTTDKKQYRKNLELFDEEHKYQEINDLSFSSSENTILNFNYDFTQITESFITNNADNSYLNENRNSTNKEPWQPPPYNKVHMFKNVSSQINSESIPIEGKSTYV